MSLAPKTSLHRSPKNTSSMQNFPISLGRLVQGDRDRFQTNLFIIKVSQYLNDCFFSLYICTNVSAVLLKSGFFYLEIVQPLAALTHNMCIAYECIPALTQII